jgi:hypothetical protein
MNEQTAIPVSVETESHKGKFFLIDPSLRGNGQVSGLEFANEDALILPGMNIVERPTGEPDQYPERPRLIYSPEKGGPPRDFEVLAGIWVVSEALKQVFERVDPDAFAFVACEFSQADGTAGPSYYLCNVLHTLDALDEARSRVKIKHEHDYQTGQDVKVYSVLGGASLVFNPEALTDVHVFRQESLGAPPVCDRTMVDALTAAKLSGVRLRDVAEL